MTIENGIRIRVTSDPFSISDKFILNEFEKNSMDIYKKLTFIEYPLISIKQSEKDSTYDSIELKTREKNNNDTEKNQGEVPNNNIITFRISNEQLNEFNNLMENVFILSNELIIKATKLPDLFKKGESINYSSAYLSIFDKSKNNIKGGILFKLLKENVRIIDYEDDWVGYNNKNKNSTKLGTYLYHSPMKSKLLKKFCNMASHTFGKNINIYTFKERDPNEKYDKNHLIISFLNNSFFVGCFINNNKYITDPNSSIYLEQLKNIYKIRINSDILINLLKNFVNDPKNPDYMSVWTKGLVMKTNYIMENDDENIENINQNKGEDLSKQENPTIILKSLIYYPNEINIINYDEIENENNLSKKEYILNIIENNINESHEELNTCFDCSLDDIDSNDISNDEISFL